LILKPPRLCASCAVWRGDDVLLILRGNDPKLWSLPGGRVERGETVAKAAARELEEETSLVVGDPHFVGLNEAIAWGEDEGGADYLHHYVVAVHTARFIQGVAQAASDAADVRWVRPDDVDRMEVTGGLKDMLIRSRDVLWQSEG
jgi:8-oxo-dGTP diphosphatase